MDRLKLVEALRSTLIPDQMEHTEAYLKEVKKIINFVPQLLQIVMDQELDVPVRQAAVLYMKNMITAHWEEGTAKSTDPIAVAALPFSIHENDKQLIRDNIVQAVITSPNLLRVQLAACVSTMVKNDYPVKWPGIAEQALTCLTSNHHETFLGALICLYQLVKNYEYKKQESRDPLNLAMSHFLPVIQAMCFQLLNDQTELAVQIQKQILKIYFAIIQFYLPLDLITKEVFTAWMEMARQIVTRPVPEECENVDDEEKQLLVWWKCKKWAIHLMVRCFERYGTPGSVKEEYEEFAKWYLKTFSDGCIQALFSILESYVLKKYVSPRCLQLTLQYFEEGVSHAYTWKLIKPHINIIIQDIIFPLMGHTKEDEELWESDPIEYIRIKYDSYEEFFSPTAAGQSLLHSVVSKRKEVLQKTMTFIYPMLISQDPNVKDQALHMIGSLSQVLLTKKQYKDQVEDMLVSHVFPEFSSEHGFLVSRVCWVIQNFAQVRFKKPNNLSHILLGLVSFLHSHKDLPVKVEAAIGLQRLLSKQTKAKELLTPHICHIFKDLLNLIRESENDNITTCLQNFAFTFSEEVIPLAVELTNHLAETFSLVVESSEGDSSGDKSITSMGILNSLESICQIMEEQKEILKNIEPIIIKVIGVILQHNVSEFFEEMLSLVYSVTSPQVTEQMWTVLPILYQLFEKDDNVDFFTDMMPSLHNFVTVDPDAFLTDPNRLEIMYNMAKKVLNSKVGEDSESHAAKLLEIILIQFKNIPEFIIKVAPLFLQLVLDRLTREIASSELRTMCLQVVLVCLYCNPALVLGTLQQLNNTPFTFYSSGKNIKDGGVAGGNLFNGGGDGQRFDVVNEFVKQLLEDSDCFLGLHDRKMFVLGMCTLLSLPVESRPAALREQAAQILPSLILVFNGLKKAYEYQSQEDDENEEDEDNLEDGGELEDDDDAVDNEGEEYLESLQKREDGEDEDGDSEDDEVDETLLESFDTLLDKEDCPVEEYQVFRSVIEGIRCVDADWYNGLTASLTTDNQKSLEEIFKLAEKKKAAMESKKIEQSGGYNFTVTQVPQNFCFGQPPS